MSRRISRYSHTSVTMRPNPARQDSLTGRRPFADALLDVVEVEDQEQRCQDDAEKRSRGWPADHRRSRRCRTRRARPQVHEPEDEVTRHPR